MIQRNWKTLSECVTYESLMKHGERLAEVRRLGEIYTSSQDNWVRRSAIRDYYNIYKLEIESGKNMPSIKFPFEKLMTPIELHLYFMSFAVGLKLFPEYPVGKYFLDFAIPHLKIDIECDGKEFHDDIVDKFRDAELRSLGWKIFRISGSAIFKSIEDIRGESIGQSWENMECWEQGEDGSNYTYYSFVQIEQIKNQSGQALLAYIKRAFVDNYFSYLEGEDDNG